MDSYKKIDDLWDKAMSATQEGITLARVDLPDQPLVYINGGFERMTGYKRDDVLHTNCRFLQGVQTDKVEIAKLRNAVEKNLSATVIIANYRKDGKRFWNRLSIAPVHNPNDEERYYVGVQSDITYLKEVESQALEYKKFLEETNTRINSGLKNFSEAIGLDLHKAEKGAKKISNNIDTLSKDDLEQIIKDVAMSTEKANDLVLNIRTTLNNFGGVKALRSIDVNSFTTQNSAPDSTTE